MTKYKVIGKFECDLELDDAITPSKKYIACFLEGCMSSGSNRCATDITYRLTDVISTKLLDQNELLKDIEELKEENNNLRSKFNAIVTSLELDE